MSQHRHFRSLARVWAVAFAFTAALLCASVMTPGLARAGDPGRPTGYANMEFGQGGFILSASGGKGTLTFKGRKYAFKVGGLGIGGTSTACSASRTFPASFSKPARATRPSRARACSGSKIQTASS
jgi:hypothetical protein